MRFSTIQQKEVIEMTSGKFLGFIEDATIDVAKGTIEHLHIAENERFFLFESKRKQLKKIQLKQIEIIGKDIVLVGKKAPKED